MVIEILVPAVLAGGGAGWLVRWRARRRAAALERMLGHFDPPSRKVVESALRLVRTEPTIPGRKRLLRPVHLLAPLLDVEAFAVAIETLGGSPAAIKTRVEQEIRHPELGPPTIRVLPTAMAPALGNNRLVTIKDLWLALARTNAARMVEVPPVELHALSFVMVHGRREPTLTASGAQLAVVLHNDDHTHMNLVVSIVRQVLGLPEDRATSCMREVHERGRGIAGRYPAEEAIALAERARELARREHSPLWIDVEPA